MYLPLVREIDFDKVEKALEKEDFQVKPQSWFYRKRVHIGHRTEIWLFTTEHPSTAQEHDMVFEWYRRCRIECNQRGLCSVV